MSCACIFGFHVDLSHVAYLTALQVKAECQLALSLMTGACARIRSPWMRVWAPRRLPVEQIDRDTHKPTC